MKKINLLINLLVITALLVPISSVIAVECDSTLVEACRDFNPVNNVEFLNCLSGFGQDRGECADQDYHDDAQACLGADDFQGCLMDPEGYLGSADVNLGPDTQNTGGADTQNTGESTGVTKAFSIDNPLDAESIEELVTHVIKILIQIGLSVSVLFIVYAGFLFVTATGNPEKLKKAKDIFIWAVIGTAVLLGALVIMEVIQNTIENIKA